MQKMRIPVKFLLNETQCVILFTDRFAGQVGYSCHIESRTTFRVRPARTGWRAVHNDF